MQGREQRREQTASQEQRWGRAPPSCFPPTVLGPPRLAAGGRHGRALPSTTTPTPTPRAMACGWKSLTVRNPFPPPPWDRPRPAGGLGATCTVMAVMLHRGSAALPPRFLPPLRCGRRRPSRDLSWGAERDRCGAGQTAGREAAFKTEQLSPGRAPPAPPPCAARFTLSQRGGPEDPQGREGRAGAGKGPDSPGRYEDPARRDKILRVPGRSIGTRGRADPADNPPGVTPSLLNLRGDFAWGAGSSRAGRRRRKGRRIPFQPQIVESSVGRVQREKARALAQLASPPAL